jgi:ABC-type dipeptide/oligopeptide/nickel transport system ATPase component
MDRYAMTEFYMTCGLSGSGKSTWARKFKEANENFAIIESDEYRIRLFNNEQTKEVNIKLFDIIHDDIISILKDGVNVIFDATNLSYKHRKELLNKLEKLENVNKRCILFATEFSIKEILFASALICYHMRPHFSKTDKAKKKLLNTIGEDMMYFLDILHNADVQAH